MSTENLTGKEIATAGKVIRNVVVGVLGFFALCGGVGGAVMEGKALLDAYIAKRIDARTAPLVAVAGQRLQALGELVGFLMDQDTGSVHRFLKLKEKNQCLDAITKGELCKK